MGRLKCVLEPSGSTSSPTSTPTLETDYSYDALSDLAGVTQWGGPNNSAGARSRSFSYDPLSRLVQATNPESGTVCYGIWNNGTCQANYDADGNLLSKVDARGVQTTFSYDALNRLVSKKYLNDSSATPYSCYQYDSSSVINGVGRLANEWTQPSSAGQCAAPPSGYLTLHSISAYDPMGRLWTDEQCTSARCNKVTPCSTASGGNQSYACDLAGNVTCSSNGMAAPPGLSGGQLTFTSSFDGDGHLGGITSNWTTFPTNLFTLQSYGRSAPHLGRSALT